MKVTQIAAILNTINAEVIGESAVVKEDLTNIVDVGREVLGVVDIENYTRSLIDRIGRVVTLAEIIGVVEHDACTRIGIFGVNADFIAAFDDF